MGIRTASGGNFFIFPSSGASIQNRSIVIQKYRHTFSFETAVLLRLFVINLIILVKDPGLTTISSEFMKRNETTKGFGT